MKLKAELFVIQNTEGKFFRAKGYGGYGKNWVDNIQDAKWYTKIGVARSIITYYINKHALYGIPSLLRIKVDEAEVLDETSRVEKSRRTKEKREAKRAERLAKDKIEWAEQQYKAAREKLEKVKKENNQCL